MGKKLVKAHLTQTWLVYCASSFVIQILGLRGIVKIH